MPGMPGRTLILKLPGGRTEHLPPTHRRTACPKGQLIRQQGTGPVLGQLLPLSGPAAQLAGGPGLPGFSRPLQTAAVLW